VISNGCLTGSGTRGAGTLKSDSVDVSNTAALDEACSGIACSACMSAALRFADVLAEVEMKKSLLTCVRGFEVVEVGSACACMCEMASSESEPSERKEPSGRGEEVSDE
jgi:hypothetical protein